MMRIAIIGIGRLGTAFANVLSNSHELLLIDRDFNSAREVASRIGAQPIKDLAIANECDMAIVAVKPAHVEGVVKQIKNAPLIVSCAAGVPISRLESFGTQSVIRIMPNICVEAGEALIAYSLHPEAERKERIFLAVFSSLGLCMKADESHLDAITAVSGSGPAYVAYLAEAMMGEAVDMGLAREDAERCVAQTFLGAGKLMRMGWSAKRVMEAVATPGGAAEAGLKALEAKKAGAIMRGALRKAHERTLALGK